MKKFVSIFIILVLAISVMYVPAFAQTEISVYLYGEKLQFDVPPQIINGRTMVPMRKIFESLKASVDWDGATRTVTSVRGDKTIVLTIDSPVMYVNGKAVTLDTAPCIVDSRTLVPARAVAEAFELKVDWDGATRSVYIKELSLSAVAYDYLKDILLKEGQYAPETGGYHIVDDYLVLTSFYPAAGDSREELWFLIMDRDYSMEIMCAIMLFPDGSKVGAFECVYADGEVISVYGEFSQLTGAFTVMESSHNEKVTNDVEFVINEYLKNRFDPSLKETFGLSLFDFGISY